MAIGCMGVTTRTVARAVRLGRRQRLFRFFMIKMGCSQGGVLVFSYRFGSAVLGLCMLYLPGRHLRGHRVAHPAAQRQQGDQQGEEQVTHE